jgi:nicotinamide phosphoribosyltransferase
MACCGSISPYTPRLSRISDEDKLVMFGLQAFIKEYLIVSFEENFFARPKSEVSAEYRCDEWGISFDSFQYVYK